MLPTNIIDTGSELKLSGAAPEMTAPEDDAVACASDREECRFVAMMPRHGCLLFDSPATLVSTWTGIYLLSVFMVGYSLSSRPSRSDLDSASLPL